MSVQLIDDVAQKTLAAASDRGMTGTRVEKAKAVGKKIAELALAQKISTVVFDRAGFRYHGRVAAVAEGARENGLTI
jgi:large subunit ribosomal protein L18